jgi:alpha-mannosidase
MKFDELIVLLPCHSLEDFPVHHEAAEAEGLLATWSALWHPALIASANRLPTWYRADSPPDDLAGRLIVVPEASESLLLAGWPARAKSEGAHLVRRLFDRRQIVAAALEPLDGGDGGVEPALADDFLAFGTGYLLTELLTRQMRYMSNIDEVQLANELRAAATAALAHDGDQSREHLRHAFEVLTEARERFYPVNSYLVDLTLVAATTPGTELRDELAGDTPTNLLFTGQVLERLAANEPQTLEALRLALDHHTADVVGGEYDEAELPLLPPESLLEGFRRGLAAFERVLGRRPTVFGRRRFGLSPALPPILSQLGYQGALHLTLDDGQFPQSDQCKTRWEGFGAAAIDALCRLPLDAHAPASFLHLPRKIGESMDLDHVATVVFAHWPGRVSPFYTDLRRMAAYGPVLGKFITLSDYFSQTDRPGDLTRFKADQYRSPYLRQAIIREQPDPLSRCLDWHARRAVEQSRQSSEVFEQLAAGRKTPDLHVPASPEPAEAAHEAPLVELTRQRDVAAARLAASLVGSKDGGQRGYVVVNSSSFSRRAGVDVSGLSSLPACQGPVLAVQQQGERKLAVVEVPGCGLAWVVAGSGGEPGKRGKPLAEERVLRNEFFELSVHPTTGGIRSIYIPGQRGNRISQQLGLRLPAARPKPGDVWRDPDEEARYSRMLAETIEVTAAGTAFGEITSRGHLLDPEDRPLAAFVERLQVWRGVRTIGVEIELDVREEPRADPWNSYYAARFAWADEAAELSRSVAGTVQPTTNRRIEAPQFIEIREGEARTTLFTGGLPYHRFNGERMLDTLLVVRGESRRVFRLAIGIDVAHPAAAAAELQDPMSVVAKEALAAPANGSSWLFHLDVRNVLATHWEPTGEGGAPSGFRVRLLETAGRAGRVHLRSFRAPRVARQLDFQGNTLAELTIEGDRIAIDFAAYEWIQVEAEW